MCGEVNQDAIDKVMGNIKPVKVMLDHERHLVFDDKALEVFSFTGGSLLKLTNMEQITLYDLISIIRASLAHEDNNLTIEGTMKIITLVNAPHVFEAAVKCLQNTQAELEKKYKQMLKKGGTDKMANQLASLFVVLGAKTQDFERGMQGCKASLDKLSVGMLAVSGAIVAMGIASIKTYADMGDAVMKMSQRTGFSTEMLSKLRYAADLSGTSLEGLEAGIKKMQRTLYDAERGLSTSAEALDALGLSLAQLKGLSPEEQFMTLAKALARVEDPSTKAAVAMEIFGRAGTDLLPMLAEGEEGIRRYFEACEKMGLVFDEVGAKKAADFNDAMINLKSAFQGLQIAIADVSTSSLKPLIDDFTEIIKGLSDWSKRHPILIEWIGKTAVALGAGSALYLAVSKMIGMFRAMAAALAIVQAMTPGGWAKLALGLGIGIGAVAVINKLTTPSETPEVPAMAGGGIIKRPTLAMLGEGGPEAVVPLGGGFGGETHNHYHFAGFIADDMALRGFARQIEKIQSEEQRRHRFAPTKTEPYGPNHL